MSDWMLWIGFGLIILVMLALDLGVFNRKAHVISFREALITSLIWIGISLAFNAAVFVWMGTESGLEFLTGYLIEKALSVDNLFVFLVIFSYFHVDPKLQHKVLFYGIFGALVMRGLLIAIGATLIEHFEWIIYIFGAFLIYTAVKLARQKEEGIHPDKNPVVNLFRQLIPVSRDFHGGKFFTHSDSKWMATPLLIILLIMETTDLVFALDSIPAIFAVTTNPFIVFTSNVFAVLGLRALYFLLAGMLGMFRYLKVGLSFVLGFVGSKMIVTAFDVEIPILVSLLVIAGILAVAILASLLAAKREGKLAIMALDESSSDQA
jgi:TerC family integral membrane protein